MKHCLSSSGPHLSELYSLQYSTVHSTVQYKCPGQGLAEYLSDLWNLADWFTNTCFISWIILRYSNVNVFYWVILYLTSLLMIIRFTSCYMVSIELAAGLDPYTKR